MRLYSTSIAIIFGLFLSTFSLHSVMAATTTASLQSQAKAIIDYAKANYTPEDAAILTSDFKEVYETAPKLSTGNKTKLKYSLDSALKGLQTNAEISDTTISTIGRMMTKSNGDKSTWKRYFLTPEEKRLASLKSGINNAINDINGSRFTDDEKAEFKRTLEGLRDNPLLTTLANSGDETRINSFNAMVDSVHSALLEKKPSAIDYFFKKVFSKLSEWMPNSDFVKQNLDHYNLITRSGRQVLNDASEQYQGDGPVENHTPTETRTSGEDRTQFPDEEPIERE